MQNGCERNKRIICVDDEEVMLETYRRVLGADDADIFAGILQEPQPSARLAPAFRQPGKLHNFEIIQARSGEEALRSIEEALAAGRPIAAGFFDMRMPGGIDGYETIRRARKLDSQILCAVVTAYTDRSVEQIAELFSEAEQDELLYFNKPFRTEELRQTAVNMVCSWNRKRSEEEHLRVIEKNRLGLQYILKAVNQLLWVPPRPLQAMLSGILYQSLALIDSEDGYIGVFDANDRLVVGHGLGKCSTRKDSIMAIGDEAIKRHLAENKVHIEGRKCLIPLVCSEKHRGLIYMEAKHPIAKSVEVQILATFGAQMVPLIMNSIFYDEIMKKKDFQMLTDPVTGLYDRDAICKKLQVELSRSSRFLFPIALLQVNLDNLASIDDSHGQAACEVVLKSMAELLQNSVRGYDIVGRNVNGKESDDQFAMHYREGGFTLVMAQTDGKGALAVAERICGNVAAFSVTFHGAPIEVVVSMDIGADTLDREKFADKNFPSTIMQQATHFPCQAKTGMKSREATS